jgi:hypothetical protein
MKHAGILEGEGYLYRPREMVVSIRDEDRLRAAMQKAGGKADERVNRGLDEFGIGVHQWVYPDSVDIPALLRRLRADSGDDRPAEVSANHVFAGEPRYSGGPGGPPSPAPAPPCEPPAESCDDAPPGIGVLDHGY